MVFLELVPSRSLDCTNIQTTDTRSSLSLDLEDLDQLSITLLLKRGHIFTSQFVLNTCRECVDIFGSPGEGVLLHVFCPAFRGGSEVFEKMSKAIGAPAASHGVCHERPDDCPSWAETCGYAGVCKCWHSVSGFPWNCYDVESVLPSSCAETIPRDTRLYASLQSAA
jgi:hypothetical protein